MQASSSKVINILFITGLFVATGASFYRYVYLKEFPIQIEVSCDPAFELCYHRDCVPGEDCPPNNLTDYRVFTVSGATFASCDNKDGCTTVCKDDATVCTEIKCDSTNDICQGIQ